MKLTTVAEFIKILQELPQDAIVADKHGVAVNKVRSIEEKIAHYKNGSICYFTTINRLAENEKEYKNVRKKANRTNNKPIIDECNRQLENIRKTMANPEKYTIVSI